MQAQPAELPTTSLQALKQRAHQLLESQRSLQQQNQALAAERLGIESERDQLATQLQELSAGRDALLAERDSLSAHLQELTAQRGGIQRERDGLQGERDQLATQHQELSAERDALQAERASLSTHLQELTAQLDSIQQERDGLQNERDQLAAQYQEITESRDVLQAERETLLEQQEAVGLARDGLLAALRQVFPYSAYRDQRQDVASLNDQDLVDHFVAYGIHEGGDLTYSAMESELHHLRSSLEDANAKAELFNQKSSHTAAQLDLLKDLFTKMAVQP